MDEDLNDEQKEEILKHIVEGRRIPAIKAYREATGMGLKEAKDVIAEWERKLRAEHPDKMPAANSGCSAVIAVMLLLLAAVAGVVGSAMLVA